MVWRGTGLRGRYYPSTKSVENIFSKHLPGCRPVEQQSEFLVVELPALAAGCMRDSQINRGAIISRAANSVEPWMLIYTQSSMMKNTFRIAAFLFALLLVFATAASAQSTEKPEPVVTSDITGLYSFLHEGEFVQIEVSDGKVTGLISHFKDEDPDKSEFVDQYFDEAKLEGSTLTFHTKPLDGLWFEFTGTVERGPTKIQGDEAYWIVRGTVIEHHTGADGKSSDKKHSVSLKSFPVDPPPERKGPRE